MLTDPLLSSISVSYSSPEETGLLTFTPAADQNGTATITVTVEDAGLDNDLSTEGDNATTTESFTVRVTPANDPPTIDPIDDVTFEEDSGGITIQLQGASSGVNEEEALTATVLSDNEHIVATLNMGCLLYTSDAAAE